MVESIQFSIPSLASDVGQWLLARNSSLVTVESCTGGGIAYAITSVSGSSEWFDRGLVTYSNQAKNELAAVPLSLIQEHGAVSIEVAESMAIGGLTNSNADIAVSVTGIAGPDGGNREKPVGTVCFAWAKKTDRHFNIEISQCCLFDGDREGIRKQSISHALWTIMELK
ncbi:MAG: CinA family protein [Arenicellales bacterium]